MTVTSVRPSDNICRLVRFKLPLSIINLVLIKTVFKNHFYLKFDSEGSKIKAACLSRRNIVLEKRQTYWRCVKINLAAVPE